MDRNPSRTAKAPRPVIRAGCSISAAEGRKIKLKASAEPGGVYHFRPERPRPAVCSFEITSDKSGRRRAPVVGAFPIYHLSLIACHLSLRPGLPPASPIIL